MNTEHDVHAAASQAARAKYNKRCALWGALLLAGLGGCVFLPLTGAVLCVPFAAVAATAFTWAAIARLFLCRDPKYLLQTGFVRPFTMSLAIPAWLGYAFAFYCLPNVHDTAGVDTLYNGLALIVYLLITSGAPLICAVVELIAAAAGWQHKKQMANAPVLYRNLPFAVSLTACLVMCSVSAWVLLGTFFSQ